MALAAMVLPLAAQTDTVPAPASEDNPSQTTTSHPAPPRQEAERTQTVTVSAQKAGTLAAQVGKEALSLKEIPQSLTVISQERIEQQALKTLDDVMLQATGVTREQLWLNNNYYARGLKIMNIRYDGGATALINDRNNNADLAQFEEVSILRGADGLFGAGDAGGVINLQSKRPQDVLGAAASISAGSWNNYRAELDVTGPLNESRSLKGRAVVVLQDRDHFFEPSHSRRELLYGALQAALGPDTLLFAGASLQKDRQDAFNASLPRYVDGADAQFPRSTTLGAPWGWLERENLAVFGGLSHRIGKAWKLKLNLRHTDGKDAINGAEMEGAIRYSTLQSDWWRYQDQTRASETLLDANLQGSFEAFGQRHDATVGIDQTRSSKDYHQNWVYYAAGNAFDRVPPPEWAYPPSSWDSATRNESQQSAVYGSLRLQATDRLSLIAGGRQVFRQEQRILNKNSGVQNTFEQTTDFVPYYGAVFELTPRTSAYFSQAKINQSQLNYFETVDGPSLRPATGRNLEFGLKSELIDGHLLASVAYFDLKKQNEAVYQTWSPTGSNAWCCYVAAGNKSSQGVDVELNGRLQPNWTLSFGYTYNDNKDLRDDDLRFSTLTPRHLLKLWSHHDLGAHVAGLSVGWGATAQSKSYQSGSVQAYNPVTGEFDGAWQDYEFAQPSYGIWSVRAAYDIHPRLSLALNLNNVFDKVYYSTVAGSGYGNFYGEPRNAMVTLTARY